MRYLFIALLLFSTLHAKQDVVKQIHTTSKKIKSYDQKSSSFHKKMARTAKTIKKTEKELALQKKKIEKLTLQLKASQERYQNNQKELIELQGKQKNLQGEQAVVEQELIDSIARNISINSLEKERFNLTTEAIMTEEILHALNIQTQRKISKLQQAHSNNSKNIDHYQARTLALQKSIRTIDRQKRQLLEISKKKQASLALLEKDKAYYKHAIKRLMAQKKSLSSTLARLNIIKSEEERKSKNSKTSRRKGKATVNVTNKGSSYQRVKSKKYHGRKTIAPLAHYRLIKKFGPYTDPIYKIKIYNESVSLQPVQQSAKVRTVLNGKIILAKKTQLLDNVVIIRHSNGLHTIYAHLDQIAPNIRKGKRVKKGSTIGRVDNELTFEVTQDSYHIDPMTLIK